MDFTSEPPHTATNSVLVHSQRPWNAEPPLAELIEHPVTPPALVYSRNHCPVRKLDATTFRLKVKGLVEHEAEYSLDDIKSNFPRVEVTAALQCAGNRRKAMQDKKQTAVEGLLWGEGTICNVKWGGVRLRDILLRSGIGQKVPLHQLHLCFASHITACEQDDWFGASVHLEEALNEQRDALLAYDMNGKALHPDHGYPLRVVVPGYSGARWVKWVDEITVSPEESSNYYQQRDYKILPSLVTTHGMADKEAWWSKVPPLEANPLNSVIATANFDSATGRLHVKGYAVGGPSGQIDHVQVSVDGGQSWTDARTVYQEGRWSWTLWESDIILSGECSARKRVISRAIDISGNVQPADMDWNLRGVGYAAFGEAQY